MVFFTASTFSSCQTFYGFGNIGVFVLLGHYFPPNRILLDVLKLVGEHNLFEQVAALEQLNLGIDLFFGYERRDRGGVQNCSGVTIGSMRSRLTRMSIRAS